MSPTKRAGNLADGRKRGCYLTRPTHASTGLAGHVSYQTGGQIYHYPYLLVGRGSDNLIVA
jgi:hypothetical protein